MAEVTVRQCDVFGSKVKVGRYQVVVTDLDASPDSGDRVVFDGTCDLGTRALRRLLKYVARGMTAPGDKGATEEDGEGDTGDGTETQP